MTNDAFAGFDLGGTNLKFGLLDDRAHVHHRNSVPTPSTVAELMSLIAEVWEELKKKSRHPIRAVGFGFPGIYSLKDKKILQSPNLPELDNYDLQAGFSKAVDVPFWVDNDANMAAYGEWKCGAGKGAQSLVLLTVGTGIGSGVILGGDLWHGACGFAGELGHITVNPEGEKCKCGSHGCLETESAAPKIVRNYMDLSRTKRPLSAEEVYQKALKGNTAAKKSFAIAGHYLGIGLGIVINLLNPEKILLGGGVMTTGDFLMPAAVEEAERRSYMASFACCSIERASLGNEAGLIGSALWAREQWMKKRR